ncbi:MAG: GumC family protein [Pseudomonadota bacterium]
MDDYPGVRGETDRRRNETVDHTGAAARERAARVEAEGVDLRALARSVWQRKLTISGFGFAFALLAVALVYAITPLYTATAVVMMDESQERIIDVESVVSGFSADYFSILAEAEVLRSRALAGRVVDAENLVEHPYFNPALVEEPDPPLLVAGVLQAATLVKNAVRGAVQDKAPPGREALDESYWAREEAIDRLLDSLTVVSRADTYVYSLTVETDDPVLSARLANKLADLYILDQLETKFEATEAATEWLSSRVADLKTELERSEAAVEAYNSSTSLISEEALAAMNVRLKDLRERTEELRAAREEAGERAERLSAALADSDYAAVAELSRQPRLEGLAEELAAADGEAAPQVMARFEAAAERQLVQYEVERQRAADQLAAVGTSIEKLEVQLESQTRDMVELRQLQREAEANRRIYEQFLRRLNETSVQQGVQQADARILSPAVVDLDPSFPNKTLTVLAAGFLGGLVGIAVVMLLEQFNRAFRTSEELEEATGLPVLGAIPVAPVRARRGLLDYATEKSSSALMEAIRNLRTGVLLADVDHTPEMVMLTSSLPKEGKTTCSLLLAQNAAGLGRKVLLIECDLRRRTFRDYFPEAPRNGLMGLLTGEQSFEEAVHHDAGTGLDVIIGEETRVNAADVFSSQRFREFLEQARERYDFVVIDTPPVLAVPDARVIAPLTDAVLYCVRWNATNRDLVRNGLNQFAQIKVRIAGLAMTQINTRKMAKYGYGGYNSEYYKASNRYYAN